MMKKRIYVAGAGGMLGEAFHRVIDNDYIVEYSDKDLNSPWLKFLDFRDKNAYAESVKSFRPDILCHIGAHTSLEYCEENPGDAYLTNTLSTEYAVTIANELDIPLFYVSTAGIFDGKKSFYDDWDTPNPLGVYARSKYMGERFVVENANRYIVCRAGWMMGGGAAKDKKFVYKLIKQILGGATTLYIVDDKDGTPTYTHDFVKTFVGLYENESYGLYNSVCQGQTSRLEVATELLELIDRRDVKIESVKSDHFSKEYFAPRPPCERLVTTRLDLIGMNQMKDWRISLKEYLVEYFPELLES